MQMALGNNCTFPTCCGTEVYGRLRVHITLIELQTLIFICNCTMAFAMPRTRSNASFPACLCLEMQVSSRAHDTKKN